MFVSLLSVSVSVSPQNDWYGLQQFASVIGLCWLLSWTYFLLVYFPFSFPHFRLFLFDFINIFCAKMIICQCSVKKLFGHVQCAQAAHMFIAGCDDCPIVLAFTWFLCVYWVILLLLIIRSFDCRQYLNCIKVRWIS